MSHEPADYRLTPPADEAAELAFQLAEMAHELTYERQMRQQTEEAMIKLARRVSEQQAELAEQEVDKMALVQELAVEKAKTALLWPVATKQTPSHDSE